VTGAPDPSSQVNSLWDLAETNPSAADFAIRVRQVYETFTEAGWAEPADARALIMFELSSMLSKRRITEKHRTLANELLPKPPSKKRGRPKGAIGREAYNKRSSLYRDWIGQQALNPHLSKEQFAKERLKITDKDLAGDFAYEHRAKMDALLQELKPARMKQLDADHRGAIEIIQPLLVTHPQYLAQIWREAKERSPKLTKEDFLQHEVFKWGPRERLPIEDEMISEYLEILDQGERRLDESR
jgi:hypothetical protein